MQDAVAAVVDVVAVEEVDAAVVDEVVVRRLTTKSHRSRMSQKNESRMAGLNNGAEGTNTGHGASICITQMVVVCRRRTWLQVPLLLLLQRQCRLVRRLLRSGTSAARKRLRQQLKQVLLD